MGLLIRRSWSQISALHWTRLSVLQDCLADVKTWQSWSFFIAELKQNWSHFHLPKKFSNFPHSYLRALIFYARPDCRNLGARLDSGLSFTKHVKNVVQSYYFQLKKISKLDKIHLLLTQRKLFMFLFPQGSILVMLFSQRAKLQSVTPIVLPQS